MIGMLCTAQLGRPVLKAFGRVQKTPFQLTDKSPMITDQHTAGGSVSQLSQLAKLSPWSTLSAKYITASFRLYDKLFCFLSNQIMGLYHFSYPFFTLCACVCVHVCVCVYGSRVLKPASRRQSNCWMKQYHLHNKCHRSLISHEFANV